MNVEEITLTISSPKQAVSDQERGVLPTVLSPSQSIDVSTKVVDNWRAHLARRDPSGITLRIRIGADPCMSRVLPEVTGEETVDISKPSRTTRGSLRPPSVRSAGYQRKAVSDGRRPHVMGTPPIHINFSGVKRRNEQRLIAACLSPDPPSLVGCVSVA